MSEANLQPTISNPNQLTVRNTFQWAWGTRQMSHLFWYETFAGARKHPVGRSNPLQVANAVLKTSKTEKQTMEVGCSRTLDISAQEKERLELLLDFGLTITTILQVTPVWNQHQREQFNQEAEGEFEQPHQSFFLYDRETSFEFNSVCGYILLNKMVHTESRHFFRRFHVERPPIETRAHASSSVLQTEAILLRTRETALENSKTDTSTQDH